MYYTKSLTLGCYCYAVIPSKTGWSTPKMLYCYMLKQNVTYYVYIKEVTLLGCALKFHFCVFVHIQRTPIPGVALVPPSNKA